MSKNKHQKIRTGRLLALGLVILAFVTLGSGLLIKNSLTNPNASASAQYPADINNDNVVNISDLSMLISKWGTTDTTADVNSDGTVNIFDLSYLISKWGNVSGGGTTTSCKIPDRVTVTAANKATYPAYPIGTKVYVPDGPDPWGGCFPGPLSTGVPVGTQLTDYTGPCVINTANTVIDGKRINNCDRLVITAKGVVVKNSLITSRILVDDTVCDTASVTVMDTTINNPDANYRALQFCSYTAIRVNATGGASQAMCSNCTIKDSYLHDPLEDPTGHAHDSSVRIGDHATLEHNTFWCNVRTIQSTDGSGESSGCSASQTGYSHDGLPPYNSTMKRNFYAAIPDGYCAYGGSTGGDGAGLVHDVKFIENIFQRGNMPNDWQPTPVYICGYYGPITSLDLDLSGNEFTNNTWDNGKLFSTEPNAWADYCGTQPQCTW